MSTKTFCDRCDDTISVVNPKSQEFEIKRTAEGLNMMSMDNTLFNGHLCNACVNDLKAWLAIPPPGSVK